MPKQNLILMFEKKIQIGFRCSKCFISKFLNINVKKRKKTDWWWGKRRTKLLGEGSSSLAMIFSINGWTTWMDWMFGAGLYTFLFRNCTATMLVMYSQEKFFLSLSKEMSLDQCGTTCGAIDGPSKSSKAISKCVIITFSNKNVVIACFWDKNDVFFIFLTKCHDMSWYVMIYHDTSWFVWQK